MCACLTSPQGFHFTLNGWVQSCGSLYVRPPIIEADVRFVKPMTVSEYQVSRHRQIWPEHIKSSIGGFVNSQEWIRQ